MLGADSVGVAEMYLGGGLILVTSAWVLLLTLFVVLELTRGLSRGALRAVRLKFIMTVTRHRVIKNSER